MKNTTPFPSRNHAGELDIRNKISYIKNMCRKPALNSGRIFGSEPAVTARIALTPVEDQTFKLSFLKTRKQALVVLRFVILTLLLVMSIYHDPSLAFPVVPFAITGIYGLSNLILALQKRRTIETQRDIADLFILDIVVVSLFVMSLGVKLVEFYAVYFLTILLAAAFRKLSYALVAAFVATLAYSALAYHGQVSIKFLSVPFGIRIVLFFVTALFVGYLAEESEKQRLAKRALDRFASQKAREARKSSESLDKLMRLYEAVTESIPSAVILCDPKMNLLFYNEKMEHLMEIVDDLKEKKGTSGSYELIDRLGMRKDFLRAADTREPVGPNQMKKTAVDAGSLYFRYRIYPIIDASGDLVFVMGVLDDITETELASKLLRASEERFRELFENAANGMLIFDIETGKILEANPAAVKMLRKKRSQVISAVFRDTIPLAPHITPDKLKSEITSNNNLFWEIDIDEQGTQVTIECHVHLIQFSGKNAAQAVLIDTTFKKEMEEELRLSREAQEAARKEVELERKMVKELERLNSLKTSFISVVTHELRTPMTSIRGAIELIMSQFEIDETDEVAGKYFDMAIRNIDRLASLINDVLDISRIESGRLKLNCNTMDIKPVITEAIETCRGNAQAKKSSIEYDAPPADMLAYFDRNSITQVLVNLIGNGIKYTAENSTIRIAVENNTDDITVTVHDNGEGIPPEEIDKIFDRFYQVEKQQNSAVKGTGLGLAICQGIVQAHGGKIWALSKPDKGTDFKFKLPVKPPEKKTG